jgi:hypothetical protein
MKSIILTFLTLIVSIAAYSQNYNISEGTKSMKEGSFNSFSVELNGISTDVAEDEWKKFMEQYNAKVKKDKKAKLLYADNVQLPSISPSPIDVYTMITQNGENGSFVSVWFDTGNGYVNSIDMKVQAKTAESMVHEYAYAIGKKAADQDLKEEEKKLSNLTNDLKKLNDKNNDLAKNITKAKDQIKKWEKELEQNDDDIIKKKKSIETQEIVTEKTKEKSRKFL